MGQAKDRMRVRGFLYCQILEKQDELGHVKVVGDSGWVENTVTDVGLDDMCAGAAIAASGSKQAEYACVATQSTTVDATQASLVGAEVNAVSISPSTVATGKGKCTFSYHGSQLGDTITLGSIGLLTTNEGTGAADLLAGATFTTSQFSTDQSVNATYQLEFS